MYQTDDQTQPQSPTTHAHQTTLTKLATHGSIRLMAQSSVHMH